MIINEKYLKQYSPIPLNYSLTEVKNYIGVAEKIWVKPVIGSDLFDEIQEQVDENNISEENSTLLTEGGLWQYLAFATVLEALPIIWGHISEVGITKGKSENSDSLSLKDMTYIQQHIRGQVEVLKDQLKTWLCEHGESFPSLDFCACGCSCCNDGSKLNKPNAYQQLYSTRRKITNLK